MDTPDLNKKPDKDEERSMHVFSNRALWQPNPIHLLILSACLILWMGLGFRVYHLGFRV
jgi:tRNA (Thr-GGU) A37 N-methylase